MTKLEVLNEGLSAWRGLPAGLHRICMALWELSDSEYRDGAFVVGRARTETIARYANQEGGNCRRGLRRLRALGIVETRTKAGRCLEYRLIPRAPAPGQDVRLCPSSAGTGALTKDPVVYTPSLTPSSPPYPPLEGGEA